MTWHLAGKLADLDPDTVGVVTIEGQQIALYLLEDGVFATSNICTHAYACMSDGYLEDGIIECPIHAGRFDVRTGKALGAPVTVDLETFEAKVEDDAIFVKMP